VLDEHPSAVGGIEARSLGLGGTWQLEGMECGGRCGILRSGRDRHRDVVAAARCVATQSYAAKGVVRYAR
jgi:hypothetical protein